MGINPTPATIDPRILTGASALVVAALLLLLYYYRRRRYILFWTAAWIVAAASRILVVPAFPNEKASSMAYGVSQFLAIVSALGFVISADAYRTRPHIRRGYLVMLLPVLLWFALAPLALGPASVFAAGHVLVAGGLAAAGAAHFMLLRQARLLGAVIIGTSMLGLAATNVWMALGVAEPDAPVVNNAIFLTLALYLITALGMQLMTFEDMTDELRVTNRRLEGAQWELRQLVTTDPLTGCRNRRFFDDVIGREMERHRRYRIPLSVLFVDIDRFKTINDTLGHEAGDRVLQDVAAFLIRSVREADYVFRWGGDEFVVLISCDEAAALQKAAELQKMFAASEERAGLPKGVGLSIGYAFMAPQTRDAMGIVKLADERMYAEKRRTG